MLVGTDSSGSKGKHRAAGLGTALSLATFYPVHNLTFNQPSVWKPNWHLPALPDGEELVNNFIRAALDIAQYPFRREKRRLLAWRIAMVEHNLVEPDSELADWVCEHNLSLDNLTETDTEDVLEDTRQSLRKHRRAATGTEGHRSVIKGRPTPSAGPGLLIVGLRHRVRWTCSTSQGHPVPHGRRVGR